MYILILNNNNNSYNNNILLLLEDMNSWLRSSQGYEAIITVNTNKFVRVSSVLLSCVKRLCYNKCVARIQCSHHE